MRENEYKYKIYRYFTQYGKGSGVFFEGYKTEKYPEDWDITAEDFDLMSSVQATVSENRERDIKGDACVPESLIALWRFMKIPKEYNDPLDSIDPEPAKGDGLIMMEFECPGLCNYIFLHQKDK